MQPFDDVVGASLVEGGEGTTDGAAFEDVGKGATDGAAVDASDGTKGGAPDEEAVDASEVIFAPSSTVVPTSCWISPCLLFI